MVGIAVNDIERLAQKTSEKKTKNDKRLKKFTKNLFYFTSHPMFNKLKKLYVENDVKQLRTIENWFNKMNITKTGTINKKAQVCIILELERLLDFLKNRN